MLFRSGDKNVKGLKSLTLSYTFFAAPEPPRATTAAVETSAPPRNP